MALVTRFLRLKNRPVDGFVEEYDLAACGTGVCPYFGSYNQQLEAIPGAHCGQHPGKTRRYGY